MSRQIHRGVNRDDTRMDESVLGKLGFELHGGITQRSNHETQQRDTGMSKAITRVTNDEHNINQRQRGFEGHLPTLAESYLRLRIPTLARHDQVRRRALPTPGASSKALHLPARNDASRDPDPRLDL